MSQDGQQDTIPHNLAYLDSIHQQETGVDTDVALNNLFGSGPDDELPHPFAQEQDLLGLGDSDALAPPSAAKEEHAVDIGRPSDPDSSSIDPALAPDLPVKRKATSRANMLTRGGACEFCKRRKLKCSAETPKCSACVRWNKDCVYGQKKQRSRVKVLEDRLAELEKKLGNEGSSSPLPAAQTDHQISHTQIGTTYPDSDLVDQRSYPSQTSNNVSGPSGDTFTYSDLGMDLDSSLDLGFNLDLLGKEVEEPDLMTLADAATHGRPEAGGKYPWAGLQPERIAEEILLSIASESTHITLGRRIVLSLLQQYTSPRIPQNLFFIDTATLLSRYARRSSPPLHPSLTLSIIYLVLIFLPPSALPSPTAAAIIGLAILGPARTYAAQAYATSDSRLIDVVAGQVMRAAAMYHSGRTLEAWEEGSGLAAMAYATGLANLAFPTMSAPNDPKDGSEQKKLQTEKRNFLIESPKDGKEYEQRSELFWKTYIFDKCAAMSNLWPSGYAVSEITTPWPRDPSTETASTAMQMTGLHEFLSGQTTSNTVDTAFCSTLKTTTLLYHATRILDRPSHHVKDEEIERLTRVASQYMSNMAPVQHRPSGEWGIQQGPANSNWMTIHAVMASLYAKRHIDSSSSADSDQSKQCIESLKKVGDCIDLARSLGDFAFEGYDMVTATVWLVVGRTCYRFASRPGQEQARSDEIRGVGDKVSEAMKILGKRIQYAEVSARILDEARVA